MRLIVNFFLLAWMISAFTSCVGGSISFKKNKQFAKADICNPFGSSRKEIDKYKEYSRFSKSSHNVDSAVKIEWDEWNNWYILLIIAPIPTYGLWKEASPAQLSFEIVNRRQNEITLNICEIVFAAGLGGQQNLKPIPKCEESAPITIEANGRKAFHLRYISAEIKQARKLSLTFSGPTNREKITQNIEIDDDWEFCTLPING